MVSFYRLEKLLVIVTLTYKNDTVKRKSCLQLENDLTIYIILFKKFQNSRRIYPKIYSNIISYNKV